MSSMYVLIVIAAAVEGFAEDEEDGASDEEEDVGGEVSGGKRLGNRNVFFRVMGTLRRSLWVVRIARVEGGRAGIWGGTERVRVMAVVRAGRRRGRRWGRCMVGL